LKTAVGFLNKKQESKIKMMIRFCLFSDDGFNVYKDAFEKIKIQKATSKNSFLTTKNTKNTKEYLL
jgi:hypothetical protein